MADYLVWGFYAFVFIHGCYGLYKVFQSPEEKKELLQGLRDPEGDYNPHMEGIESTPIKKNNFEKVFFGLMYLGAAVSFVRSWISLISTNCISSTWGFGREPLCGVSGWGTLGGLTLIFLFIAFKYLTSKKSN